MSKWIAVGCGGVALTAASVGGYFLFGTGGGGEGQNVGAFGETKDECKGHAFAQLSLNTSDVPVISKGPEFKSFLGTTSSGQRGQSCVSVKRHKAKEVDGSRWYGNMSWSWFYAIGNRGFLSNVMAETHGIKKLSVVGTLLMLENVGGNWTIKGKRIGHEKKVDKKDLDRHLPRPNPKIQGMDGGWGFVGQEDDFSQMCDSTDCSHLSDDNSNNITQLAWNNGGGIAPHLWCSSLAWWDFIYGSDFGIEGIIR